jgi:uncharacterized protein YdaU (DUF1376 family)
VSKKPAAIPLFADAYLADTTHLTTEEHGAYLLLMMAAWRQADCALPDDDAKLARIAGVSRQKWASIKGTILDFWQAENGRIFQPRLRRERAWVAQKSEGSKKSAQARWGKQDTDNKEDGGMRSQCDGNAPPPTTLPNGNDALSASDFWTYAVAYLGEARRPLIGKWRRDYGQAETANAITAAQFTNAVEPVAYIERTLRGVKATTGAGEVW